MVSLSPPLTRADQLYAQADQQAGYFTQQQAQQAGYSRRLQHHHTTRGHWQRVGWGLYRLQHYPTTPDEDLARLSLWSRDRHDHPQAVISHDTALRLYDLSDHDPTHLHLSVPPGFRKTAPSGVTIHHTHLDARDIQRSGPYRLTTPLRTLLDLAASPLSPEHLQQAVRQGLARGLVRRIHLAAASASLPDSARVRLTQALDHP